jgi:TetR/AcrR family transcriptional regulator
METAGRPPTAQPVVDAKVDEDSKRAAPLYKRLPRGPHRMDRNEVVLNQRARLHGAMLETVAEFGYERTSVKRVVALSGVSRKTFYEQFTNKQVCFLETFDEVVRHCIRRAKSTWLACDGDPQDRLRALFQRFAQATENDRRAAVLTLVEAQTAGAQGVLRVCRASATCEQMLAEIFSESEAGSLPMPIVRGIVGGLQGALCSLLRQWRLAEEPNLAEEMLRWTLLFQASSAVDMSEQMASRLAVGMKQFSDVKADAGDTNQPELDDRERILQSVLRLSTLHDYHELSTLQIAEQAGVSFDTFGEIFTYKDECYLAALEMVGLEILAIVENPDLGGSDWPRAVRRAVKEMMCHLAARPVHAQTIAQEAFCTGAQAVELTHGLAHQVATLLTEGAPCQAQSGLAVDAIAGAIWHTIRCQVSAGRVELLAAIPDHLTYIVLAPFIGADAAFASIADD